MKLWIGITTACLLWFLGYLLLTQVWGHGGVAEGSIGSFYLIWFLMVGSWLAAPVGLLVAFGLLGRLSAPLPEDPDDIMGWHLIVFVFMLAGSSTAVVLALDGLESRHLAIGKAFVTEHVTGGNWWAYYLFQIAYWFGLLFFVVGGLSSPVWGAVAVWGVIKLIVLWVTRPAVYRKARAIAEGEPVPHEAVVQTLEAALPQSPFSEPWWLLLPGAKWLVQWMDEARAWWANRTAAQFETAGNHFEAATAAFRRKAKATRAAESGDPP